MDNKHPSAFTITILPLTGRNSTELRLPSTPKGKKRAALYAAHLEKKAHERAEKKMLLAEQKAAHNKRMSTQRSARAAKRLLEQSEKKAMNSKRSVKRADKAALSTKQKASQQIKTSQKRTTSGPTLTKGQAKVIDDSHLWL